MMNEKLIDLIYNAVKKRYPDTKHLKETVEISEPKNTQYGDISTNIAFKLAKELNKPHLEISSALHQQLGLLWPKEGDYLLAPTVAGFLNFRYTDSFYGQKLAEILQKKEQFGSSDKLKGKKIQVEYISANPTGPLTLANGRGGFSGDVLANLFTVAGAKVDREYLINDGGNQVVLLGKSALAAAKRIEDSDEYYHGEYIADWAKNNQKIIDKYFTEPKTIGQLFAGEILEKNIKPAVKNMKISFDSWFSENALIESGAVEKAIEEFSSKSLTFKKDGALWFRTTNYGDDKDRVLIKEDGETTYFANDAAYHWDKLAKRKYDLVVNFWGADHHGYVNRLLAAVSAMGFDSKLQIIIMQMVRLIQGGQEVKMSKRKGTYVTISELLELIGGEKKEAADIARFFFLSRDFSTHMDFDLDLAREHSEKNPVFYVKYAHARACSVEKKAKDLKLVEADFRLLQDEERELIKELAKMPQIVEGIIASEYYPVHQLVFYCTEVATKFHLFYDRCQIIDENNLSKTATRLEIVKASKIVLKKLMVDLIGISAPEKM